MLSVELRCHQPSSQGHISQILTFKVERIAIRKVTSNDVGITLLSITLIYVT